MGRRCKASRGLSYLFPTGWFDWGVLFSASRVVAGMLAGQHCIRSILTSRIAFTSFITCAPKSWGGGGALVILCSLDLQWQVGQVGDSASKMCPCCLCHSQSVAWNMPMAMRAESLSYGRRVTGSLCCGWPVQSWHSIHCSGMRISCPCVRLELPPRQCRQ